MDLAKEKKQYYIWVLGCQMNKSDGERIDAVLSGLDFKKVNSANEADIVVVVACSVRQKGIQRIFSKSHYWQKKRRKGELYLILTGCVLEADKKKFKSLFDLLLPIDDIGQLPQKLAGFKSLKLDDTSFTLQDNEVSYFHIKPRQESSFQAYVPIMTGCNNFCTYCVVPHVRGREKSRPANEIITECRDLIKRGYKEITLLGQNVNSYISPSLPRRELEGGGLDYDFPQLLEKIDKIKGDYWLRFVTSHPKDLSDNLIKVMKNGEHITPYLHLPVQAGDDDILLAMNRGYTVNDYLSLVKKVRYAIPNIMLSTDVIVGFPGETKEQFNHTVKLFEKVEFDMAYISRYSQRADTAAAKLQDDVVWLEKKRRDYELTKVFKKTALIHHQQFIGKTIGALVERHRKGMLLAKSRDFRVVKFKGDESLVGQLVKVKITKAEGLRLLGELL